MRFSWFSLAVLAASCLLPAGATTLRNPVTGYVFDAPAGVIRPVNGLPGGAVLGAGLESPIVFAAVQFAPGQRSALAVSKDGETFWLQLEGSEIRSRLIPGGRADLAAFDDSGRYAVLYTAATRSYRIVDGGLAGDAAALPDMAGKLEALAIDSAAKTLLAAVSGNDSVSVFAMEVGSANARFAGQALSVDSLWLSRDGNQFLFSDRLAHQVMAARRVAGDWTLEVAADGRDGLNAPLAARLEANGALVVLNGGSNEVLVKTNGLWERLNIPAKSDRLAPMAAPGVLELTSDQSTVSGNPLYLLEIRNQEGASAARVVFVPAGGQQ